MTYRRGHSFDFIGGLEGINRFDFMRTEREQSFDFMGLEGISQFDFMGLEWRSQFDFILGTIKREQPI